MKKRKVRETRPKIDSEEGSRNELLAPGRGRLKYESSYRTGVNLKSGHDSVIITFKVVVSTQENVRPGDLVDHIFIVNGKSEVMGRSRLKACGIKLAGFENDEEARVEDPNDDLTYELLQEVDAGWIADITGKEVDYVATQGTLSKDGTRHYLNVAWYVKGDPRAGVDDLLKSQKNQRPAPAEPDDDDDDVPAPTRKRRPAPAEPDDDDDAPAPTRKRRPAPAEPDDDDDDDDAPAPTRKRRPAPAEPDDDDDDAPAPTRKRRPAPAEPDDDDDDDDAPAPARGRRSSK